MLVNVEFVWGVVCGSFLLGVGPLWHVVGSFWLAFGSLWFFCLV